MHSSTRSWRKRSSSGTSSARASLLRILGQPSSPLRAHPADRSSYYLRLGRLTRSPSRRQPVNTTLFGIGLACVIAALVGGGLRAAGFEFPIIASLRRQVLLAALGGILIIVSGALIPRSGMSPLEVGWSGVPSLIVGSARYGIKKTRLSSKKKQVLRAFGPQDDKLASLPRERKERRASKLNGGFVTTPCS